MKNLSAKILGGIMLFSLIAILPIIVLAKENENIKVITITNNNKKEYVVYVQELLQNNFSYAVSQNENEQEEDLDYLTSSMDKENNNVAIINAEDVKNNLNLYIKTQDGKKFQKQIDFSNSLNEEDLNYIEKTTKRIETEIVDNIVEKDEEINGINTVVKVGGLNIKEKNDNKFYYQIYKATDNNEYEKMFNIVNEINSNFNSKNMYEKIDLASQFYTLYKNIIENVNWKEVNNMQIKQPSDAVENEKYVVLLKESIKEGEEITDIKLMTSKLVQYETKQNKTETRETKTTSRLPITGDSIKLFVILITVGVILVVVYFRMKRLKKKEE